MGSFYSKGKNHPFEFTFAESSSSWELLLFKTVLKICPLEWSPFFLLWSFPLHCQIHLDLKQFYCRVYNFIDLSNQKNRNGWGKPWFFKLWEIIQAWFCWSCSFCQMQKALTGILVGVLVCRNTLWGPLCECINTETGSLKVRLSSGCLSQPFTAGCRSVSGLTVCEWP